MYKIIFNPVKFNLMILLLLFSSSIIFAQVVPNCTINAGVDRTICASDAMVLTGNVPSPIQMGTEPMWTQIGGPIVVIETPNNPVTNVLGYTGGNSYSFRYSAICGNGVETSQEITITVRNITIADAGMNIAFCPDTTGSISVTGNTPGPGETGSWSVDPVSNEAGVVIDSPGSTTTTLQLPPTSCGVTSIFWSITGPEIGE